VAYRTVALLLALVLCPSISAASDDPVFDRAMKHFRNREYEPAAEAFLELAERSPDYFQGWFYAGYCRWLSKRYAEAEKLLERAVELSPESFQAHYILGRALRDLDRYEEAAARFGQAMEHAQDEKQMKTASSGLGEALYRAGSHDLARSRLEAHIEKYGASTRDLNILSLACRKIGDHSAALRRLEEIRKLDPGYPGIDNQIADLAAYLLELAFRDGRFAQVIEESERTAERFPADCRFVLLAARAHGALDRYAAGIERAEQAAQCGGEKAWPVLAQIRIAELRSLIQVESLIPAEAEIEERFRILEGVLANYPAGERHGEAKALEVTFRERLGIEKAEIQRKDEEKRRIRCERLRKQWWEIRTADDTGADVEPLNSEEKRFLQQVCRVTL
jgi:tetratricopeptide (TPR) repeat protein